MIVEKNNSIATNAGGKTPQLHRDRLINTPSNPQFSSSNPPFVNEDDVPSTSFNREFPPRSIDENDAPSTSDHSRSSSTTPYLTNETDIPSTSYNSKSPSTTSLLNDIPSTSSYNADRPDHIDRDIDYDDDPALTQLLRDYHKIIHREHQEGIIQKEYNFVLNNFQLNYDEIEEQLNNIYQNEKHAFKINFSFGIVLRNTEGELRYFYASGNESTLDEPFQISKKEDVNALILRLKNTDLLQTILKSRPNSKWTVYVITNIRWLVTRTNYILGSTRKLPDYIKNKRSIITLDTRSNDGALIEDNLCAFRCLAYHKTKNRRAFERLTIKLYREYFGERVSKRTNFKGLCLNDIPQFENAFDININIFQLF